MTFMRPTFTTLTSTTFGFFPRFCFLGYLAFFLVSSCLSVSVNAFTWRWTSSPAQCESTSVIWQGGSPPYKILLLPIGFQPQGQETRVIFEKTTSTGTEMSFAFPFPASSKFVAVMSDSTGFGSGGTSAILTVGSSNTSSCIPTTPSEPEFYLYLSSTTLSQCQNVHISWDTPANPPVTIYGVIPQGQSFDLNAASHSNGGTGFDWTINIRSGTQFFFVAGDGNGSGKGGSTDAQSIGNGSSGCINASSPSATPDSGVGSVGSLPTATGTGTAVATATQGSGGGSGNGSGSGSGSNNGSGDGSGNSGGNSGTGSGSGSGNGNGSGSGNGNGNGNGGGGDAGSGGGTVYGPSNPTAVANSDKHGGSKIGTILAIVISLLGIGALLALGFLFYKRRQRKADRRDNQRTRLLLHDDASDNPVQNQADLPHARPGFLGRWPGGSLESLGNGLRATPFIWPVRSSSASPTTPRDRIRQREERDGGYAGDVSTPEGSAPGATTTARPPLQDHSTSSGLLRRMRSARYGGSGFGFPFGGGSGYRSLGDGANSTPSSQPHHTMDNSGSNASGFGAPGHHTTNSDQSGSSVMPSHKSPLPAGYGQHTSQNSHGSSFSHFSSRLALQVSSPNATSAESEGLLRRESDMDPQMLGIQEETLTRPGAAPLGPRPPPGPGRPSFGRVDTGGSVWEVPPTYASLQRRRE